MAMRITHLVPLLASAKRTSSSSPSPTAPAPGYSRNSNNQRNKEARNEQRGSGGSNPSRRLQQVIVNP
ncbi:hypothetical protein L2E82_44809 [Cichorium intybus]|uniref:Uncharacterized protein n=1 Tax=Cichorium intybus TaxID=13427 RepID=A0ACB8ZSK0_CICIN|nr:hypothetical protein L2E82_44809 [Cichorium intybus]